MRSSHSKLTHGERSRSLMARFVDRRVIVSSSKNSSTGVSRSEVPGYRDAGNAETTDLVTDCIQCDPYR